jgi:hypothetical protein
MREKWNISINNTTDVGVTLFYSDAYHPWLLYKERCMKGNVSYRFTVVAPRDPGGVVLVALVL